MVGMAEIVYKLLKNKISLIGLVIIIVLGLIAIFAPWIAPPQNPDQPYYIPRAGWGNEPKPPSREHIFGTAEGQYDIFMGLSGEAGLLSSGFTVVVSVL